MRAHIVENGIVVNTIIVDSLDLMPNLVADDGRAGIGWSYIDGVFVDNQPTLEPEVTPTLTKEQLLEQLQQIQAQINNLS